MWFREIHINDLKIVAPLKCGTRWLLSKSNNSSFIYIDDLKEQTDNSTIFLYREPEDHLISALLTDYIIKECDLNKTLDDLLNFNSAHWRGDMYENIHRAWCYHKFKMINYLNISDLIGDYELDKNIYDFSKHPPYLTKQEAWSMVPNDIKEQLFIMSDNNEYWLKQIQENNDKVLAKNTVERLNKIISEKHDDEILLLKDIINQNELAIKHNNENTISLQHHQSIIDGKDFIINQNKLIIENYRRKNGKISFL
jgi:hypothetical protein